MHLTTIILSIAASGLLQTHALPVRRHQLPGVASLPDLAGKGGLGDQLGAILGPGNRVQAAPGQRQHGPKANGKGPANRVGS
jgi:hypothetical protein